MTTTISTDSLAHINTKGANIQIAREDGTGLPAGLSKTAKLTLEKLELLKQVLGQNAGAFHIILERNEPAEGSYIHEGDDCHNSWHIAGLQAMNPKLHVVESLLKLTGVEPASKDGRTMSYNADQLKTMLAVLSEEQGLQR